jgi:ubiquinone/menaquinone biosynthesis C-methylase UbiE
MDPKSRFSNRVNSYIVSRPSYPVEFLEWMRECLGLTQAHVIADIGSGTGLLSQLLLNNGNTVIGVEPNEAMRNAGERILAAFPAFRSVSGTAEETTLPISSVDFVVAGQAFHWFDPAASRIEWERIAKPGCWSVLVWNESIFDESPFALEYDLIKERYGRDLKELREETSSDHKIEVFFGASGYKSVEFRNPLRYTLEQLQRRAASSSYLPAEGDADFEEMMHDLEKLFARHVEADGFVAYDHCTRAYYAQIA